MGNYKPIAVILMFALLAYAINKHDETKAKELFYSDTEYVIYLGTNDKEDNKPVFSNEVAKNKLREILKKHFDGYTITEADGGFKDGDKFYEEHTFIIYLKYTDLDTVKKASKELLNVFNQTSVIIERKDSAGEVYDGTDERQKGNR